MEAKPIWLDQRNLLADYRAKYRERSRLDGHDTTVIDRQLSELREQMTPASRLKSSQFERAWRRAA